MGDLCPLQVQALAPVLETQAVLRPHGPTVSLPRDRGWGFPGGVAFQRGLPVLDHGDLRVQLLGDSDPRWNWAGKDKCRGKGLGLWASGSAQAPSTGWVHPTEPSVPGHSLTG